MTDRRAVFANETIAHTSLKGKVRATRYSDGSLCSVCVPVADIRLDPTRERLDRQVLFGNPVRLLDSESGFARDETSGYVGYLAPRALESWIEPTHRVTARATFLFDKPDLKRPNPMAVSCGSLVRVEGYEGRFGRIHDGRFAFTDHLSAIGTRDTDLAGLAENLLGTPYLWGGNSSFGIDCSGLVQLACQAAGLACPGDSDQQCTALGMHLPRETQWERNDLLFWQGHVAIVAAENTLIHANAHAMSVTTEPLMQAVARIEAGDGPLLAHKRITD